MCRTFLHARWILTASMVIAGCQEDSKAPGDELPDTGAPPAVQDASADTRADASEDASLDVDAGEPLGLGDAGVSDAGSDASDARVVDAAPVACNVVAPTSCPADPPSYATDVAPIIKERCAVCHGADWTGNWPLDTYGHVADWQDDIRSDLLNCRMPPPESGYTIPEDERTVVLQWLRCGLPR